MSERKVIPFSPPDITQAEIDAVVEVLKSGWITSGPNLAAFEKEIEEYCRVENAVALNSATAAMELVLKTLDIKEGDEIISTPYTYTATSSVAIHRGIKPIYVDVKKDTFFMDEEKLAEAITPKTKVIMPVDIAGYPCDYDGIKKILKDKGREDIIILCDSAHSFGAKYKGQRVGSQCDFHSFSFHAVKNLTTAEGGALTYNDNIDKFKVENLLAKFKLTALHGQSKDALSKMKAGAWEYDIITDGFKCNMTDINAAIGLAQLSRYGDILAYRRKLIEMYNKAFENNPNVAVLNHYDNDKNSSGHLYLLRLLGKDVEYRNEFIRKIAEFGIATNVHYKPLPMLTAYKNLGFKMEDYPNAYDMYKNEITLPLNSVMTEEQVKYVIDKFNEVERG